MDDLKVELGELCFAPDSSTELTVAFDPAAGPPLKEGAWTEAMMRDLLSESLSQLIRTSMTEAETRTAQQEVADSRKDREPAVPYEVRIENAVQRLYKAVSDGNSAEIIRLMCDLTPLELHAVVPTASEYLRRDGLNTVDVRIDDFDRIVLFHEEKNRGVAMAPSGSYQRVSRFYDGSYRYGIELLLDDSMFDSVEAVFQEIRVQLTCQ
jgi:hypothetical protein